MTRGRDPYADRDEAGRILASCLEAYSGRDDVVVLGLPRGGVPVAAGAAARLGAALDVIVVRKLGAPGQPELAMGAIAEAGGGHVAVRNDSVIEHVGAGDAEFAAVRDREVGELQRRRSALRGERAALDLHGRVVIVVDDGLATGSTMRAAVAAVRRQRPARIVVAVPIGAGDTCAQLRREADGLICPWQPRPFVAVGQGYRDFRQTTDERVRELLATGRTS